MPISILQKAVDELGKESPKLDYIRGLLETLIEIQPKPAPVSNIPFAGFTPPAPPAHIGANGKAAIKMGPLSAKAPDPVIQSANG